MDPLNVQPAPASPPAVPVGEETPTSSGLSQEQMIANLQGLMEKINGKYQDFNSDKFSADNQIKEQRSQSLQQLFDLLQSAGVDPSNVEEVKAFLDSMKEKNPELAQQFEQALQILLGQEEAPSDEVPEESQNMNINTSDATTPQNL